MCIRDSLLVPYRLRGGDAIAESQVQQAFDLADETRFEHGVDPRVDAPDQVRRVDGQAEKAGRHGLAERRQVAALRGIRRARVQKLEGPHDAPNVVGMQLGSAFGVARTQQMCIRDRGWIAVHHALGL